IIDFKTLDTAVDIRARLDAAAARKDDREFFRTLAFEKLEQYRKDQALMRLLLFSALEGHELSDIFFESTMREIRGNVRLYIRQRTNDGAFREIDPDVCTRAFMGMVIHQAQVRILHGDTDDVKRSSQEIADSFVEIFINGITKGETAPLERAARSSDAPSI
ncbi:MAG TPA: TetR/AcrR family transcriptional regulator C-terminal domain-containing protein, partial [Blastocatellia bacterium]|nr:TetR/AcrR family transcriptional regulator C-terminal domain-containing protein [Blastocatellia bacterium]